MAKAARKRADDELHQRIVVLDTSAIVADPEVVHRYPDSEVVVPLTVIEELDGLKKRADYTGKSAREAIRKLWGLIDGHGPDRLSEPVKLPDGGLLRVEVNGHHEDLVAEHRLDLDVPDNRILNTALSLRRQQGRPVTLVSNDVSFRLKAAVVGIAAEELRAGPANVQTGDTGYYRVEVAPSVVDLLWAARKQGTGVRWAELGGRRDGAVPGSPDAKLNEYFELTAGSQSVIARVTGDGLRAIGFPHPYGLKGRSAEQHMAIDLLMDPAIPIVALAGHAGTGKTLLALATGLAQTVGENFFFVPGCRDTFNNQKRSGYQEPAGATYERMVIYRPLYSVGHQDIGFLPGDVEEKLGPWMEAVTDAMVALSTDGCEPGLQISYDWAKEQLEGLKQAQKLSLDAITFLRGRSLQRHFLVVDEAQNFELNDLKTVLTRVGVGTKVVFVGDTSQIDNPYASARSNALAYLCERFAGHPLFGHLVLQNGQRSAVADLAASLL
jgi:PhoH-like ATPase